MFSRVIHELVAILMSHSMSLVVVYGLTVSAT